MTDVVETPSFDDGASTTRSIAENSAAGTNVGAAVSSSGGQAALTYTLDGTDKDKFTIVSTSGQIQVKTGHVPDYEAKTLVQRAGQGHRRQGQQQQRRQQH